MRHVFMVAAGAALALAPAFALAQSDTAASPPSASGMKGSPNADGYGKDSGPAKNAAGADGATDEAGSAQKMKGSPNANGYSK